MYMYTYMYVCIHVHYGLLWIHYYHYYHYYEYYSGPKGGPSRSGSRKLPVWSRARVGMDH